MLLPIFVDRVSGGIESSDAIAASVAINAEVVEMAVNHLIPFSNDPRRDEEEVLLHHQHFGHHLDESLFLQSRLRLSAVVKC